jgi:hypothetical protein
MAELTAEIFDAAQPLATRSTRPWDVASMAALACGVFLIVPFLAGVAAIALALLGIRQINESNQMLRGKRLAAAGAILGILNIAGWSIFFIFISTISGPGRRVAHHFIDDLGSSNPGQASRECFANVHADRLQAASDQLKTWGGVKSVAVLHITSDSENGVTTGRVTGTLRTPTGDHAFRLETACEDTPDWKVRDFSFQ